MNIIKCRQESTVDDDTVDAMANESERIRIKFQCICKQHMNNHFSALG